MMTEAILPITGDHLKAWGHRPGPAFHDLLQRANAARAEGNDLTAIRQMLDADLPPAERAVVDLSAKLTRDPEALTAADLAPLRDLGLDDLTILDVLNYAAFFANANRLMLTLGEPTPAAGSAQRLTP